MQGNPNGIPAPTPACIDAETLAAWADGGLPKAEAALVETHVSNCERCTAMLATFVRTMPEAPPVAESVWNRWSLRWLVPLATAATVAALWVLIPTSKPQPASTPESARDAQVAAPPAPQSSVADEPKKEADAKARTDTFASTVEKRPATQAPQPLEREQRPARADETREEQSAFAPVPGAPPAAPAPAPAPAREADNVETRALDGERAAAPAAAAGAPPPPTAAAAEAPRPFALPGRNAALARAVAQIEVISPDPMTRWRVIGAGQVERSTTAGAKWERATLPESATLTGGSSPSPSICWLVGRTGAMYVTTDGLRFTKVPFPDRTDFISIQAIDGRRATVVTTDGRRLRTEDQGATWIRVSP